MSIKQIACYAFVVGMLGCASSAALADGACGNTIVYVHAVALSNRDGDPPHDQTLNQTWPIPAGTDKQYGGNPNGAIVTQGYPSNGGSHSWEFLRTDCTVTAQLSGPPTMHLITTATTDINSGTGTHTGASSEFNTTWQVTAVLPATPRAWNLLATGIIKGANINPAGCSISAGGLPIPLPNSAFSQQITGLTGTVTVSVFCSQGKIVDFPIGPQPTGGVSTVISDVTLNFTRL